MRLTGRERPRGSLGSWPRTTRIRLVALVRERLAEIDSLEARVRDRARLPYAASLRWRSRIDDALVRAVREAAEERSE